MVAGETLIFAANGFHCPLTAVAQDLGDGNGSVTDIYLPRWFARILPGIHVPLILAAVLLHWRNWRHHAVRDSQRQAARAIVSACPDAVTRGSSSSPRRPSA